MIKTKIINQIALMKLYSLNEYQKSFATRITFKVEMIDTFNINIIYNIPLEAKLTFDLNSFNEEINEEINKALFGKPADYINTHLVVLEIIMETFNQHLIGVCLNKEIEDIMVKQIKAINNYD